MHRESAGVQVYCRKARHGWYRNIGNDQPRTVMHSDLAAASQVAEEVVAYLERQGLDGADSGNVTADDLGILVYVVAVAKEGV